MSAGAVAGVVHEFLHHYTQPIVRLGVREGLSVSLTHTRQPLFVSFTSVLPSAVGFLAYEYAIRNDHGPK